MSYSEAQWRAFSQLYAESEEQADKARAWQFISKEEWWNALDTLPPAYETCDGFCFGEVLSHRECLVTGKFRSTYIVYYKMPNGDHYKSRAGMTIPEFNVIHPADIRDRY